MDVITDLKKLKDLKSGGALFVLFGAPGCHPCQQLRPQLDTILARDFAAMRRVYVDCSASADICAQYSVFSLPAVKAYIDGMLIMEEVGSFSIGQLVETLRRPYSMWQEINR